MNGSGAAVSMLEVQEPLNAVTTYERVRVEESLNAMKAYVGTRVRVQVGA